MTHAKKAGFTALILQEWSGNLPQKISVCAYLLSEDKILLKRQSWVQIKVMNITHILLGSTAAILIAALFLSYSAMKNGEAENGRRVSAEALMEDNIRLQAEIARLRSGQGYRSPQPNPTPEAVPEEKLNELEQQNRLLREQLETAQQKAQQAEEEAIALTEREAGKQNSEKRRANLIQQATLMAQVKEVAEDQGIHVIVLDVKMRDYVPEGLELGIRRGTGIIGRLQVSRIDIDGNYFADPLPGSFPGGAIDVSVGDELIVPPL